MYVYDVEFAISMVHLEQELTARNIPFEQGSDEYTVILVDAMPQDLVHKYGANQEL